MPARRNNNALVPWRGPGCGGESRDRRDSRDRAQAGSQDPGSLSPDLDSPRKSRRPVRRNAPRFRYTAVASNRLKSAAETLAWYAQRGETSENRIKELKLGFGKLWREVKLDSLARLFRRRHRQVPVEKLLRVMVFNRLCEPWSKLGVLR